jgi:sulfur-oxidizing protein SoxY
MNTPHLSSRRRELMQRSAAVAVMLAGTGLWPRMAHAQAGWNKAAFDAKNVDDVMKALGAARPVESKDVSLTAPDIAENGAVVPIGAASALPGVKRLLFLVEKNPNTLAGWFDLSDAVAANVSTRIKMAETSRVYAVAMTADDRVLFAQKQVKVTLGGCGG